MGQETNKKVETILEKQPLPLEAYKILVTMLQNDENLIWRRSEIFLLINGGLFTLLGLITPLQGNQNQVLSISYRSVVICIIGIILCLAWVAVLTRGELFYNHWFEQLKFLEREYLFPIQVFTMADEFFANGYIRLGELEFRLTFLEKHIRMFRIIAAVPVFFIVGWIILIIKIL